MTQNYIPPEIWMEISSYLPSREVKRLALLCRTFATIGSAQSIFLPTGRTYWQDSPQILDTRSAVGEVAAHVIAKRLGRHIKAGMAISTKSLVFFSIVQDEAPSSSQPFWEIAARSTVNKVKLALSSRLSKVYPHFTSLDCLTFLLGPAQDFSYPDYYRNLHLHTLCDVVSYTLRELIISVVHLHTLSGILPRQNAFPTLEIMRFSCDSSGAAPRKRLMPPGTILQLSTLLRQFSALYTNQLLRELELRVEYPDIPENLLWDEVPRFAEALLPQGHTFPKLKRFTFWQQGAWRLNERRTSSECLLLTSFIQIHAPTLEQITLNFPGVVHELRRNPPAFSTRPSFSFEHWSRTPTLYQHMSELIFRPSLAAVHYYGSLFPEPQGPHSQKEFSNLRRLVVHKGQVTLDSLATYAQALPLLVSLEVIYSDNVSFPPDHSSDKENLSSTSLEFSRWHLKDLSVRSAYKPNALHYDAMRMIARWVPSIESFGGRGDMLEIKEERWETLWPFEKNFYMGEIMEMPNKVQEVSPPL